jgi:hypothetical protein
MVMAEMFAACRFQEEHVRDAVRAANFKLTYATATASPSRGLVKSSQPSSRRGLR